MHTLFIGFINNSFVNVSWVGVRKDRLKRNIHYYRRRLNDGEVDANERPQCAVVLCMVKRRTEYI